MSLVGIHSSGPTVRLCGIDDDGCVEFAECVKGDQPFSTQDLLSPGDRFASTVSDCLRNKNLPIYLALPGGAYQIRRVPLEVTEEVDRRSQVAWEVTQALSAKNGDYSIDYVVRGSSAIWVAVPTSCVDGLTSAFSNCGVTLAGVCAGSIAMAQTLRRKHPNGRVKGILAEPGWISTVELQDRLLISATTQSPAAHTESDVAQVDAWSALLEKSIGKAPVRDRTYLLGEQTLLQDFLKTTDARNHPDLLYPSGVDEASTGADTLTSVAYGAALFGMDEEPL